MQTTAISTGSTIASVADDNRISELGGEDFFKLLIAQLVNQDPLEPTTNQELLQQVSSIREIELSTSLVDSLKSLTGQQRFGAASSLIGQYATGQPDASGQSLSGTVVAVRFTPEGSVVLQLDSGAELELEQLATVTSPAQAARELIGKFVQGIDTRDPQRLASVEGMVTNVIVGEGDEIYLELDTGEQLRFRDVIAVESTTAAAQGGGSGDATDGGTIID
jgi:hypothetical protein